MSHPSKQVTGNSVTLTTRLKAEKNLVVDLCDSYLSFGKNPVPNSESFSYAGQFPE
jgi:hypothetical protein